VSLMLPICPWCAGFTGTVERLCVVRLANEEDEVLYCHSSIAPLLLSFGWPTAKQAKLIFWGKRGQKTGGFGTQKWALKGSRRLPSGSPQPFAHYCRGQ
jgi:hypothetical protein